MSEQIPPQPNDPSSQDEVLDELRALGQNLAGLLRGAWESDERRRLQEEIQKGLADVTGTINRVAGDISQSPTGQTIKADLEGLQDRLHTGELADQIRGEVLSALRLANSGLKKAGERVNHPPAEGEAPPPPPDSPAE